MTEWTMDDERWLLMAPDLIAGREGREQVSAAGLLFLVHRETTCTVIRFISAGRRRRS